MIDFEIPEETRAIRNKVRQFVREECHPAERFAPDNFDSVLAELRQKARGQGLWCPFIPEEYGGMGLRPLANALVQMELGESFLGALSMNTQGPDDATMMTLLEHGTDDQKERFLTPLLNGEKRICYSMTEKAAGADATGMQTSAVLDGDEWVLNGEKWFSSSASVADIAVVMAKTDPDAPRHEQYSTFIVELPNPGYQILRNIETMQPHTELGLKLGGSHSRSISRTCACREKTCWVVEAKASTWANTDLPTADYVMACTMWRWPRRALDLAAEHVSQRQTFGKRLADRQGVRWMLADCASEIYKARLVLLHIAYKAEKGMDIRNENGIAKVFLANMVHQLSTQRSSYTARSATATIRLSRDGTPASARNGSLMDQTKFIDGEPAQTSSKRLKNTAPLPRFVVESYSNKPRRALPLSGDGRANVSISSGDR